MSGDDVQTVTLRGDQQYRFTVESLDGSEEALELSACTYAGAHLDHGEQSLLVRFSMIPPILMTDRPRGGS